MPKIIIFDDSENQQELEFSVGYSLMEVLRDAGYEHVEALCGGSCSCATCHVHILPESWEALDEREEDEQELLELADDYDPEQSRLSCQIELDEQHDGLKIKLV